MSDQQHIIDDKITFRELLLRMVSWLQMLRRKWKLILLFSVVGAILGALVAMIKKPVYTAETSFVLEETNAMGGMGGMSGIASLLGINLGSLGSANGLFQGENILELYRSQSMLAQTLLSPFPQATGGGFLIDRYIQFNKLDKKWSDEVDFSQLDFHKERDSFTVQQDSVVREIIKEIKKRNLEVGKPDRKLSIIRIAVRSKDEAFAKVFNETLVKNVNEFYYQTKTKKTGENLEILQHQTDSVRQVLNQSLERYAAVQDLTPNPNPLLQKATVEARRSQVDVQASLAVYEEMVKNLEIAKINHRNNSPLIQIIDSPRYPLEEARIKLGMGIVVGAAIFFLLALFYIYLSGLFHENFREKKE